MHWSICYSPLGKMNVRKVINYLEAVVSETLFAIKETGRVNNDIRSFSETTILNENCHLPIIKN